MLLQHQSVVGPTQPLPPTVSASLPLSLELTPIWHSHLIVIAHIPLFS